MKISAEMDVAQIPQPQNPANDENSKVEKESSNATNSLSKSTSFKDRVQDKKKHVKAAIVIFVVVAIALGLGLGFGLKKERYPNCAPIRDNYYLISKLGDGVCDNGVLWDGRDSLNLKECGHDDGDCDEFNEMYKNCSERKHPSELEGFGSRSYGCNQWYNTKECGYDDGDCIELNTKYPGCKIEFVFQLGDGECFPFSEHNTEECAWDGGDCLHPDYPNCTGIYPPDLDNGRCDVELNREECGFDNGACEVYNKDFPECLKVVDDINKVADGRCHNYDEYNTAICKFDGGDCDQFNKDYENCTARETWKLGDGECTENDPDTYNSAACGFEGGDCIAFNTNETYAECKVANPSLLGNGMCNGKLSVDPSDYNSEACAFDGGDCSRVNEYPNCTFPANFLYQFLGDGDCHKYANIEDCGFDLGDCNEFNTLYPNCDVLVPLWVGDGRCDSSYNTTECGYDGGDCL